MNRYLWCVLACLLAAGIVYAVRPRETPPPDDAGVEHVEDTAGAGEKRMRITILCGGSGELPDGVSDWFRSTLENAEAIALLDPLTDQLPLDPAIHFHDGERTYGLVDDSVILIDYRRTTGREFLRAYKHDAFRRLNDRHMEIFDFSAGDSDEGERAVREAVFRHLRQECRAAAKSQSSR